MAQDPGSHPWLPAAIGLLVCGGLGVIGILGAFDVGPIRHEDINGPPWLSAVAGALFLLFGAMLLSAGRERFRSIAWLCGFFILITCALLGNWVAFGPGPRHCSGGVSFLFFSLSGPAAEIECRLAFGIGAVMLDAILLWGLGELLQWAFGAGRLPALLQKTGKGILLLSILPFLLIVLAVQWAQRLPERRRRPPPQA